MRRAAALCACGAALGVMLGAGSAAASTSNTDNWSTQGEVVVCGVAEGIEGTEFDPGTGAPLKGSWRGLQCQAPGIPHGQGIGDPAVQLGQGQAGRARLVDISQDDLVSDAPYGELSPGSVWKGEAITCTVTATSVRCTNEPGYGFTLSSGHLQVFSPTVSPAPKRCGSVSYTFPHTDGHGHAALNDLTAVDVSCATARAVAKAFVITGKPPAGWHATQGANDGRVTFKRGDARVSGNLDS